MFTVAITEGNTSGVFFPDPECSVADFQGILEAVLIFGVKVGGIGEPPKPMTDTQSPILPRIRCSIYFYTMVGVQFFDDALNISIFT